jgi:photosystem II stability/assembly factor-like uncharacterized protein
MRHETHNSQHPLTDLPASSSPRNGTPGKYISTLLRLTAILLAAILTTQAKAQWDIEDSHTTASLRGIYNVGGGVAWASGTNGTVIRTEDGGYLWQTCTIPPGAEKLDFRGIQAFDENTAIVMSSGPGDQSRLYKTTDGCQSWHLLFTNPDKEGFWDALQFANKKLGFIAGDPVPSPEPPHKSQFVFYVTEDGGATFKRWANSILAAEPSSAGAFAASNSSLVVTPSPAIPHGFQWFGTGGTLGPKVYLGGFASHVTEQNGFSPVAEVRWNPIKVPLAGGTSAAGTFSVALQESKPNTSGNDWILTAHLIAVGGDYQKPEVATGTAAFTTDGGQHWTASTTPPRGYRSAVAYDAQQKLWITVGPTGTDISTDDGKNWHPLKPSNYDPADADKNWNALSLPFVVGPSGRIGRLRTITVPQNKSAQ